MSNLKLPTMTFEALAHLSTGWSQVNAAHRTAHAAPKTIAYATTAEFIPDDGPGHDAYVIVRHHGTVIAELGASGWIFVTNAGYDSQTTRAGVHKILVDNTATTSSGIGVGRTFYGVTQRQGKQVLFRRTFSSTDISSHDTTIHTAFKSLTWDPDNGLRDVNGSPIIQVAGVDFSGKAVR